MKKQILLLFLVSNLLLSAQINDLSLVTNYETFKLNDTNTISTYGIKLRIEGDAFSFSDNITVNTSLGYKQGNGIRFIDFDSEVRFYINFDQDPKGFFIGPSLGLHFYNIEGDLDINSNLKARAGYRKYISESMFIELNGYIGYIRLSGYRQQGGAVLYGLEPSIGIAF
jgi:hypothetical protein